MELTKFEMIAKLAIEKNNSLSDVECLSCKNIFLSFEELIGKTVPLGYKFTYEDKLYKTRPDNLLIQEQYIPSINTASLYEEINEKNQGSLEDPIPYNNNMALEVGFYLLFYFYKKIEKSIDKLL